MRIAIILFIVLAGASVATAQKKMETISNVHVLPGPCFGADLSIRHASDDAAMGGHNLTVYAIKNESARECWLLGYPRFELLTKAGSLMRRGRAVNSRKLMGDEEQQAPQNVPLEAGKEAMFRVYSNNGGAGRVGKPCPTSHWVRIVVPGTTRGFVLRESLTSCQTVQVSAVRPMTSDD